MRPSARTAFKVLPSVLLGLFSVPMLGYGGYLFVCWFRIHTSSVYYADYPYATAALAWFGVGLLSLGATLHGVWRRGFYGLLFVIPVFLGLAAMANIPNLIPRGSSAVADSNYLSDIQAFFRVWYEDNRRFPANEAEFRDALWRGQQRGNTVLDRPLRAGTNSEGIHCRTKSWLCLMQTARGWQMSHSGQG